MKYLSSFTFLALFFSLLLSPFATMAESPADPYADSVYANAPTNLLNPSSALGAPDGQYAGFLAKDAYLTVDMGFGESGMGDLTIHLQLLNYGATVAVTFYDKDWQTLATAYQLFPLQQSTVTIPYTGTVPYRYVKLYSTKTESWNLDAIAAAEYEGEASVGAEDLPPDEEEEVSVPGEAEEMYASVADHGLLIRLPDDGNTETTYDNAVYFVGASQGEATRHAFPNETVFRSWYQNYDDLAYVDADIMPGYPLGKNVTVRPGTYLVKLQTDPKVYAVEPGGVLRWVSSEDIAVALYGDKWAQRVIDVSDVFFGNYTVGEPIDAAIHPDGTLAMLPTGELVYIQNASYYHLNSDTAANMRFEGKFSVVLTSTQQALYVDMGYLEETDTIRWPY